MAEGGEIGEKVVVFFFPSFIPASKVVEFSMKNR